MKRKETSEFVETPSSPSSTTASFFLRIESFTILRLRLKMKPADRRNRFLEKDIFFRRSRERARGVFSSRDNKNSVVELNDPLEIVIYCFRKRVSIRIPSLLFASPRAGRRSSCHPLSSRAPLNWAIKPVPVTSSMTLIAHKLIDKSFRVLDRQSLILSMFALKRWSGPNYTVDHADRLSEFNAGYANSTIGVSFSCIFFSFIYNIKRKDFY